MKTWITLLCASAVLFASCTKQDLDTKNDDDEKIQAKAADNSFYVSNWEQVKNWKYIDSAGFRVFYSTRETPQLTADVIENGVVVTYSKVNTSDPEYMMFSKPIMLPFYFLPPNERAANSFYWYDMDEPGMAKISYRIWNNKQENPSMPGSVALPDFQFRYFVISKAYLDSKGVDARTVKHFYTYQQLINFLGLHG